MDNKINFNERRNKKLNEKYEKMSFEDVVNEVNRIDMETDIVKPSNKDLKKAQWEFDKSYNKLLEAFKEWNKK